MQARFTRLVAVAGALAALACGVAASAASAQLPPGVDALASASAKGRTTRVASPRLYTNSSHTLLLAFVVAGGATARERVSGIAGDGLHWRPVARSDGPGGATEVWTARAKHWLSGRIVATLAAAASPASITVVAYAGASPYLARHASSRGRASTPRIALRPVAGSLVWTVGLSQGQRRPVPVSSASPNRRIIYRKFDRRRRTGAWVEFATVASSHVARAAGASWSRSWSLATVDVVVPNLKRLIEEGLLNAFGAVRRRTASAAAGSVLPSHCPRPAAFEVGVQDDQVFLGLQPAMSPTRGFELAREVFNARLLRLNVDWGEVKLYGWAPYDRAVQMARERCWTIHMTITWTPAYAEGFLNHELSAHNLNAALLASFAGEIATRYRGLVGRFAVGNEPNVPYFMAPGGGFDDAVATYDQLYMAAYNAIKAADPSAEVIAGEVSGKRAFEWLANVVTLPSSGVGLHPYGSNNEHIPEFVRYVAPVPLLISEDGVQVGTPHQIARDLELEEIARAAGAKEFVFYQLSRQDKTGNFPWNTGIE
jgi:hypothetical protein